jgi:hypothetical protein
MPAASPIATMTLEQLRKSFLLQVMEIRSYEYERLQNVDHVFNMTDEDAERHARILIVMYTTLNSTIDRIEELERDRVYT